MSKREEEWFERYLPKAEEAMDDYLRRVTMFKEMEFVMMKINQAELVIVGESFCITKVRHLYVPRLFAVQVIRDLIFLCYTEEYEGWQVLDG